MLKDLKNVIITFGLIALVFAQGSSAYQNKIKKDQLLSAKIEELQKIKDTKLAQKEQNNLIASLKIKQQELLKQKNLADQLAQQQANQTAKNKVINQAQIDAAQQQAILLAQQQAQVDAQLLAQQQAKARAQALLLAQQKAAALARAQTAVAPSRQSRAS